MNRFIRLSQTSSASSFHVSLVEDDRVYGGYSAVCVYHPIRFKTHINGSLEPPQTTADSHRSLLLDRLQRSFSLHFS